MVLNEEEYEGLMGRKPHDKYLRYPLILHEEMVYSRYDTYELQWQEMECDDCNMERAVVALIAHQHKGCDPPENDQQALERLREYTRDGDHGDIEGIRIVCSWALLNSQSPGLVLDYALGWARTVPDENKHEANLAARGLPSDEQT